MGGVLNKKGGKSFFIFSNKLTFSTRSDHHPIVSPLPLPLLLLLFPLHLHRHPARREDLALEEARRASRRPPPNLLMAAANLSGARDLSGVREAPPPDEAAALVVLPLPPLPRAPAPRPRGDDGPELARDGLVGPPLEGDDVGCDLGQILIIIVFFEGKTR